MATSSKTMSGARALVQIIRPGKSAVTVGLFNNISWSLTYDTQPVYILGRFSPAEIDYTAQEPVSITCSGWRVIDHGAHAEAAVPHLQDLLKEEYLAITVLDRKGTDASPGTPRTIASFRNVRATGYSTTLSARSLEEITVNFTGIYVEDETGDNIENPSAADLP